MKLLFDQNLSRHLVQDLSDLHPSSAHVITLALDSATDHEIWTYARDHGYTIVSKDADFRQLAFLVGPPPKVIWLGVGNASTHSIGSILRASTSSIARFEVTDEESLLVLPPLST